MTFDSPHTTDHLREKRQQNYEGTKRCRLPITVQVTDFLCCLGTQTTPRPRVTRTSKKYPVDIRVALQPHSHRLSSSSQRTHRRKVFCFFFTYTNFTVLHAWKYNHYKLCNVLKSLFLHVFIFLFIYIYISNLDRRSILI